LLKNNPQVFSYELENEMVDCPAKWANHAMSVIRSVDPNTPICVSHGGGGMHTADQLWWARNTSIDYYSYHLYPHGWATGPEIDYGMAVDVLTRYGRLCGPSFMGESSGDQFSYHPDAEVRQFVMRDIIWMSLLNGDPGCFFWNARGREVEQFKVANEVMSKIDWNTFRRARPEIGIDVYHPLADDKYYRSPAGRRDYEMMARYTRYYLDRGIDFDFTLDTSAYPKKATLKEFAPPVPRSVPFRVSEGFQVKYYARDDWSEILVYVRNFAGIVEWRTKRPHQWSQWLRYRKSAPLRIGLNLPHARYTATVYDLDLKRSNIQQVPGTGELSLGSTTHDIAIVLRVNTSANLSEHRP